MEPPPSPKPPSQSSPFVLKLILYIVHLVLISYLIISLNTKGDKETLELYTGIRDSVYKVYAGLFLLIAVAIVLKNRLPPQLIIALHQSLPLLILSLIFFTFSYSLALAAASLLNLL